MNMQAKPNPLGIPVSRSVASTQQIPEQKSKIELLLDCEAAMRSASTAEELSYLIVNEWRLINNAKQIYSLEKGLSGTFRVAFASDITKVDPRSPLCTEIAGLVQTGLQGKPANEWHDIGLDGLVIDGAPFAFRHSMAANISCRGEAASRQILALAPAPYSEADRIITARLASTAAHAYWAMLPKRKTKFKTTNKSRLAAFLATAAILAGFIPVPLSILAPVEIVAMKPFIAAAPLSGVIDGIDVAPNSLVNAGDALFRLNDVELKSTLDIAQKSVAVAEARVRRAQQGAGASTELRREVGIAQSELAMSLAERDAALARLERTIVRAPNAGVVMFNRKEDWIGKPVSTGERILEIADPKAVEASIEVGLADSIVLNNPQAIILFMDSDPLRPVSATFRSAGYQSQFARNQQLAFPVRATLETGHKDLRIGQRGTAQIRAQRVSLAYFLFRRPLAALRQMVGL
ncbi:MAG: efflux RND transporter periplasmic adaptor subunit [Rhizobiaceae bacterium]